MTMLKVFAKSPLFILVGLLMAWHFPAVAAPVETVAGDSSAVQAYVDSVNINKASVDELAGALSGIGQKRAEDIVAYRKANGPFTSIDQLLEIKGIGEKVLAKNRHLIVLE